LGRSSFDPWCRRMRFRTHRIHRSTPNSSPQASISQSVTVG
jgi:hypothetical protein